MNINAELVKKLREKTGAGIMDCKRALGEAEGDFGRAEEILKELGLAAVAKRAGRASDEGRVFTYLGESAIGIMELSCETDFVARNEDFIKLGSDIIRKAVEESLSGDDAKISELITQLAANIKENIVLRRWETHPLSKKQIAADYIHGDSGGLGVFVILESSNEVPKESLMELAKDLALHAAAFNPLYLNTKAVDQEYLRAQEKIFAVQADQLDRPEKVREGIVKGKLAKHLKEICFLEQPFVKNDSQSVAQVLAEKSKTLNSEIVLSNYRVFKVGEEL